MGQKCQLWAKFGYFWAKKPFLGDGVKLLVSSYQGINETPFLCWKHWSLRLRLAARDDNVLFGPKDLDKWGKKPIFCMVIAIFVDRAYNKYARGYNFPIWSTLTKLGGTVRAIKKMTQNDNRPGPGQNYGETVIFTLGRKCCFNSKKHPKFL